MGRSDHNQGDEYRDLFRYEKKRTGITKKTRRKNNEYLRHIKEMVNEKFIDNDDIDDLFFDSTNKH